MRLNTGSIVFIYTVMSVLLRLSTFLEGQSIRSDIGYDFITLQNDVYYTEYGISYEGLWISIKKVGSIDAEQAKKEKSTYVLRIENRAVPPTVGVSAELIKNLYYSLSTCYNRYKYLIQTITKDITKIEESELKDRIEEFDVITNGNPDYINLNNLYDFYKVPFNEKKLRKILNVSYSLHKKEYNKKKSKRILNENNIYHMKHLKKFNEAIETECQTPDAVYNISIDTKSIDCKVDLPFDLELSDEEAAELEANIHNMLEITLGKYFNK